MVEPLRDTPLDAEQRGYVDTLGQSAQSLLAAVEAALDLSRIEAGSVALEHRSFSPLRVAQAVFDLRRPQAESKGLAFMLWARPGHGRADPVLGAVRCRRAGARPSGRAADRAPPAAGAGGRGQHGNQALALAALRRLGVPAEPVGGGREAVRAVAERPVDVVLMDLRMPGLDGVAATRAIRALPPGTPQPWIVAVTADAHPDDRERRLDAGVDTFIAKPLRLATLVEALLAAHPHGPGTMRPPPDSAAAD